MDCLKCEGYLHGVFVDGVNVEQCVKCSGIWFDFEELEKILDATDVEALRNRMDNNQGHDEKKGRCPKCGGEGSLVPVKNLEKSDVHIDTCTVCYGKWLDGGELEQLREKGVVQSLVQFCRDSLR